MRDRSKDRKGVDRVLMAVAATFLVVSATSNLATSVLAMPALGQSDPPRASAAELAIDAAIPRPEPANVPPPTAADFKTDTTATVPDAAKAAETPNAVEPTTTVKAVEPKLELKPAEIVTAPAAEPKPIETPKSDTATVAPAPETAPAPATAAAPAAEPVKAASNVPAEDQPVADRLRETLASKTLRTFDRKTERSAVEKFYSTREYAPVFTKAGNPTATLTHAMRQITDWRAWLTNNLSYATKPTTEGGLGLDKIRPDVEGLILIGRRSKLSASDNSLRAQMSHDLNIAIHTYDYIADVAQGKADMFDKRPKRKRAKA